MTKLLQQSNRLGPNCISAQKAAAPAPQASPHILSGCVLPWHLQLLPYKPNPF